ncbi:hypothetical protein Tco_0564426 [Tanacetum coccineum]
MVTSQSYLISPIQKLPRGRLSQSYRGFLGEGFYKVAVIAAVKSKDPIAQVDGPVEFGVFYQRPTLYAEEQIAFAYGTVTRSLGAGESVRLEGRGERSGVWEDIPKILRLMWAQVMRRGGERYSAGESSRSISPKILTYGKSFKMAIFETPLF